MFQPRLDFGPGRFDCAGVAKNFEYGDFNRGKPEFASSVRSESKSDSFHSFGHLACGTYFDGSGDLCGEPQKVGGGDAGGS